MEGLYLFAKKMVDLKYPNGHKYREMFIVGLYGLFCKFKKYYKTIWTIFMQMENYIDDKPIMEIIKENNLDLEPNDKEDYAISSNVHVLITDQNDNFCHILEKPVVVCSNDWPNKENKILLLNSWCHEMLHLLKGIINGYKIYDSEGYHQKAILRCGLSIHFYDYDKYFGDLHTSSKYDLLDEAINTIQTTEVIDEILALKEFATDSDIVDYLTEISEFGNYDYGYDLITQEVRKLWSIDNFRNLIENNIVQGNVNIIKNTFNSTIGDKQAFSKLDLLLDHIYNADEDMESLMSYYENVEKINEFVSIYKSKSNQLK